MSAMAVVGSMAVSGAMLGRAKKSRHTNSKTEDEFQACTDCTGKDQKQDCHTREPTVNIQGGEGVKKFVLSKKTNRDVTGSAAPAAGFRHGRAQLLPEPDRSAWTVIIDPVSLTPSQSESHGGTQTGTRSRNGLELELGNITEM
jgi:hypothetical protein